MSQFTLNVLVAQLIVDIGQLLFIYYAIIQQCRFQKESTDATSGTTAFQTSVKKKRLFLGEMVIEIKRTWDMT